MLSLPGAYHDTPATLLLLGLMLAVFASLPWLRPRHRPDVALLGSILTGALVTRWLIVVPLLFAALAVRVSRSPWAPWRKLALLFAVWLAVAVLGWFEPGGAGLRYGTLAVYWSCLPAAIICLVTERARGQLDGVEVRHEWAYLLAMPRFVAPFVQPIGAGRFVRSWQTGDSGRRALRALALGLYAIGGFLVIKYTHYSVKSSIDTLSLSEHGPRIARNGLRIYAYNATAIFFAIPMLRLLGYDLGSGFRFPLLASSFADVYRRWNYYFFEFASSIFYLPLVSRLRRWLPLSLSYAVAGYASFFCGLWLLERVSRLPSSKYGTELFTQLADWRGLLTYAAVWSLIIWPQVLLAPARRWRRFWWWRAAGRVAAVGLGVAILVVLFSLQLTLY